MNTFVIVLLVSLAFASASSFHERIAGGVDSKPGEQPSFVLITLKFGSEKTKNCGGALIRADTIVTATSCFIDAEQKFPISIDFSFGGSNKPDKTVKPCVVFSKDGYEPSKNNSINNMAIVKLCKDIKRTKNIDFVEMETNSTADAYVGKTMIACGYGSIDNKNTKPKNLQCTKMTGALIADCPPANPDTICTSNTNDNNVCIGDVGGPLYLVNPITGRSTLAGIYAFSADARPNARCLDGHKSVFTQVGSHYAWVIDLLSKPEYNKQQTIRD